MSESVFDFSFHDNDYSEDENSTDDPEYVPEAESQGLNKSSIISINNRYIQNPSAPGSLTPA